MENNQPILTPGRLAQPEAECKTASIQQIAFGKVRTVYDTRIIIGSIEGVNSSTSATDLVMSDPVHGIQSKLGVGVRWLWSAGRGDHRGI